MCYAQSAVAIRFSWPLLTFFLDKKSNKKNQARPDEPGRTGLKIKKAEKLNVALKSSASWWPPPGPKLFVNRFGLNPPAGG